MTGPRRERLFTAPLVAFLAAVGAIVGYSLWTSTPRPDLDGSIRLLADGDLDGAERRRMLARVIDLSAAADTPRGQCSGLLAAVALDRGDACTQRLERLGAVGGVAPVDRLPAAPDREWLDLGDPMLGNLLAAMAAEAAGDAAGARTKWSQVRAEARLVGNRCAGELAQAALARLR